ncbi:MAG: DUF6134 family protein [Polymorphobacter sp.]
MIDRRELLLGGAVLAALPLPARAALPVPAGDRLAFDVMRKGSRLGTHVLTFERKGDNLVVRVAVELMVKAAFITLYRYSHRATERWVGDEVVALDSTTDDDGKKFTVTGRRENGALVVQGSQTPRYVAPANAHPATHWNRSQMDGPWINTQDGKLLRPRVVQQGVEAIATVKSGQVRASRLVLSGDVDMNMWYDQQPTWSGLSFKGKDGTEVRYVRQ